jgi:hypothetical protein
MEAYSSGVPNRYKVLGLPGGETDDIRFIILGSVEKWKIRRNRNKFKGACNSAEEALAVVQAQVDAEPRTINSVRYLPASINQRDDLRAV